MACLVVSLASLPLQLASLRTVSKHVAGGVVCNREIPRLPTDVTC